MIPFFSRMFPSTNLQDLNLDWICRRIMELSKGIIAPFINPNSNTWMQYDPETETFVDSGVSAIGPAGPEGPAGPADNSNLLINWLFEKISSYFPVNQRLDGQGQPYSTWTSPGYTIDCWKLISGTAELTSAGLVLNGTLVQIMEYPITESVVCSALLSDGSMLDPAPVYNATNKTFTITATGQTIKAVKLELGDTQTLARNVDGVWTLNDFPTYADQQFKCKRYYQRFIDSAVCAGMIRVTELVGETRRTSFWFNLPLPVSMYGNPGVTSFSGDVYIITSTGLIQAVNPTLNGIYNLGACLNVQFICNDLSLPDFSAITVLSPTLTAAREL